MKTIYNKTQHIEHLPTRPALDRVHCLDYENPYLKRYGVHWKKELEKNSFMNKYTCIMDICDFVYEQSKKVMKGTKHENDWFFIMMHYLYS